MAVIDIGPAAIDRGGIDDGYTNICLDNPANATGIIDTIEIWAASNIAGDEYVGTFYLVSGTTYKCRDVANLGPVTSGSKQTFSGQSISVTSGDYLGAWTPDSGIDYDVVGYAGVYGYEGNSCVVDNESSYVLYAGDAQSVYGTGTTETQYSESAAVSIGVLPLATRELAADRDSSVIVGVVATASKSWGVAVASSVLIGVVASATKAWGRAVTASVIIGEVVSATRAVTFTRASSVMVGNLVSASRLPNYPRAASVIVGITVTASKAVAFIRKPSVLIGNLVSATRGVATFTRTASVIIGVFSRVWWATRMKRRITSIGTNRTTTFPKKVF